MARYLVTGGAGFIGRHLCRELLQAGHEVRILDSLVEQVHDGSGPPPDLPAGAEFVQGDVRDREPVRRALRGVDGVFHLAAEVGVGQSMYEVGRYVGTNDLGTAVLMEELARSPVRRVVVASSMSIYGEGLYLTAHGQRCETARRGADGWEPAGPDGRPLLPVPTDEDKRPDLSSVYALSKYAQERLVLMLSAAYGMEAVALRLFNVFGPGQALSNPYTGVLAIFAGRLLNGQPPLVFEDGRQRRDFVHVGDVARAFRLAMELPGLSGEVFNIGSGESWSVAEVAQMLAAAMGRGGIEPRILHKARTGDIRHCFADTSRAAARLGFHPRRNLRAGLPELVEWVSRQQAQDRTGEAHRELEARGLVA